MSLIIDSQAQVFLHTAHYGWTNWSKLQISHLHAGSSRTPYFSHVHHRRRNFKSDPGRCTRVLSTPVIPLPKRFHIEYALKVAVWNVSGNVSPLTTSVAGERRRKYGSCQRWSRGSQNTCFKLQYLTLKNEVGHLDVFEERLYREKNAALLPCDYLVWGEDRYWPLLLTHCRPQSVSDSIVWVRGSINKVNTCRDKHS